MCRFCLHLVVLAVAACSARAADPTGLNALDFRYLPVLRTGRAHLASSTDPAGGNNDRGHYRSRRGGRAILLETAGPGQISRIWSANPRGRLLIWLDDDTAPRVDLPFAELARVTTETPRVEGYVSDAGGGVVCWFPMPFAKYCRVAVDGADQLYYQINYTTYPPGTPVKAFVPGGFEAPTGGPYGDALEARGTVPPGQGLELFRASGAKTIRRLALTLTRPDGTPLSADQLRAVDLQMTWDSAPKPSVHLPATAFLACWLGAAPYLSAPMAAADWTFFTCDFPMPFRRNAVGRLVNRGPLPVRVSASTYLTGGARLDDGYFHAAARAGRTVRGKSFRVADLRGRGHLVGVAVGLEGPATPHMLEGDEEIVVDGDETLRGTGTEDYFDGAWFFRRGAYADPYAGAPVINARQYHVAAYRWHVGDCVPFRRSLTVDLEHGPDNDTVDARYRATAYWYAATPQAVTPLTSADGEMAYREPRDTGWTFEAEDGARLSSSPDSPLALDDTELPMRASGGKVARYAPASPDDALRIPFKLDSADLYEISLRALSVTLDTVARYRLDDGPVTAADTRRVAAGPFLRLGREALSAGPHTLELWLEASAAGPKRLDVDFLRLTPVGKVRDALEIEQLACQASGGSAALVVQSVDDLPADARRESNVSGGAVPTDPVWSGGGQLRFTPGAAGDAVTVPFEVLDEGDWGLALGLTRGNDYGACAIELDGRRVIDSFNTALPDGSAVVGLRLPLGTHRLSGGPHTLRVVSVAAAGRVRPIGLDYLLVKAAPRGHEAEHLAPASGFGGLVKERFGAEPKWSGGAYARFAEPAELKLFAPSGGRYRLIFHAVRLPGGGEAAISIGGSRAAALQLECRGEAESPGPEGTLEVRLRRGPNKVEVVPSGGDVALDSIELERLGGGARWPLPSAVAAVVILAMAVRRRRRR